MHTFAGLTTRVQFSCFGVSPAMPLVLRLAGRECRLAPRDASSTLSEVQHAAAARHSCYFRVRNCDSFTIPGSLCRGLGEAAKLSTQFGSGALSQSLTGRSAVTKSPKVSTLFIDSQACMQYTSAVMAGRQHPMTVVCLQEPILMPVPFVYPQTRNSDSRCLNRPLTC